jgi:hypothetical protein
VLLLSCVGAGWSLHSQAMQARVDPSLQSGEDLIDALPYLDKEWEHPGLKDKVNELIEEEMRRFRPR